MTEIQWACILIFLAPTMIVGLPWSIGHHRVSRPAPVRIHRPAIRTR